MKQTEVAPFYRSTRTPEAHSLPIKVKSTGHQDWLHTVLNVTTPPEPTITRNLDDMPMEDSQLIEGDKDDASTHQIKLLSPEPLRACSLSMHITPSSPLIKPVEVVAILPTSEIQGADNRIDALLETCQGKEDETLKALDTKPSALSSPSAEYGPRGSSTPPESSPMTPPALGMSGHFIKGRKKSKGIISAAEERRGHKRRRCSTDSNDSVDYPKDYSELGSQDGHGEDSEYHDDDDDDNDDDDNDDDDNDDDDEYVDGPQDDCMKRRTRPPRHQLEIPGSDEIQKAELSLKQKATTGPIGENGAYKAESGDRKVGAGTEISCVP
ncbi:hypothetical protein BGX34_009343 [Mortierella sp. NVP85]|nr:hypothetical protein BGX34_009343 [Mortierella sp. NVP85]